MLIRLTVISEIEQIAAQHQRKLAPLTDDSLLMNTGLDSLCCAVLVTRLEDRGRSLFLLRHHQLSRDPRPLRAALRKCCKLKRERFGRTSKVQVQQVGSCGPPMATSCFVDLADCRASAAV
jgi:aryl carrier-like protein